MGYRLNILDCNNHNIEYYGTKLYGYVDTDKLLSYSYLIQIGKFDGDECFDYSCDNNIILDCVEYKIFIELYAHDLKEFGNYGKILSVTSNSEKILAELYNSKSDKEISWM